MTKLYFSYFLNENVKKMKTILIILGVLFAFQSGTSQESNFPSEKSCCASASCCHQENGLLAPVSIMGDHNHHQGRLMFSYRLMSMQMKGMLQGSSNSSTEEVLQMFMASSEEMQMTMHMVGGMYGLTDKLTIGVMANYVTSNMTMVNRMGMRPAMQSDGFGDLTVKGIYALMASSKMTIITSVGIRIPTGSIDITTEMPDQTLMLNPYPMQTGSGTFDFLLEATAKRDWEAIQAGLQGQVVIRTGSNSANYRLGNTYRLNGWVSQRVASFLEVSLSVQGLHIEPLTGADARLNPMMSPLARTDYTSKNVLLAGAGVAFHLPGEVLKNVRLAAEYQHPIAQDVEGFQMDQKNAFTAGIFYTMH